MLSILSILSITKSEVDEGVIGWVVGGVVGKVVSKVELPKGVTAT
jgi:hypothetical protein